MRTLTYKIVNGRVSMLRYGVPRRYLDYLGAPLDCDVAIDVVK